MPGLIFYIVDVFAEKKLAGNQLAVFRAGDDLNPQQMLRIAAEMHFSETTFILSEEERNGGIDVRIFTPAEEVPFAGHPTLGTAHIIRSEIQQRPLEKVTLNLPVGQIPVSFTPDDGLGSVAFMQQIEPQFGDFLSINEIAPVIRLDPKDFDDRYPIQQVSTGIPFFLVPLRNLDALKRASVDREAYFALIKNTWARPLMIFSPEAHEAGNHLSVRMFADCFGIPEDPATGSGQGCLAAYLVHQRYFGSSNIDIRSEQGYEIGRPSLLYLKAYQEGGSIKVMVGGRSITIAQGVFV